MLTKEKLRGVWAPVPATWDDAGEFDDETFGENTARLCAAGVHGVYTTGTTGEFYAFSLDEFRRMIKVFAEASRGTGVPTQAGCTAFDTRDCIRRAEIAAEYGIDGVQVALPPWVPLTDDEVVRFFSDVSEVGLPITHYNVAHSGRMVGSNLYRRIVAEVPALIGDKLATDALWFLTDVITGVPELVHGTGDWHMVPYAMLGAQSFYSLFIIVNPRLVLGWYDLCKRGEWDKALEIQKKVYRLTAEVEPIVQAGGWTDMSGDKAWGELSGFLKGSRSVRPPYTTLPDEVMEAMRTRIMEVMPEMITLE